MKIAAIDFETANSSYSSPCSLGISVYEDGEIRECWNHLFRPFHRYNFFTNTFVHGICKEDVADEKEFYEYYEEIRDLLKDALVVAHNAPFDIGVLNAVCDTYGLDHMEFDYLDTVKVSRIIFPDLRNHKLDTLCDYLGITLNHHEASSDAEACLMILLKAMQLEGCENTDDFIKTIGVKTKRNH